MEFQTRNFTLRYRDQWRNDWRRLEFPEPIISAFCTSRNVASSQGATFEVLTNLRLYEAYFLPNGNNAMQVMRRRLSDERRTPAEYDLFKNQAAAVVNSTDAVVVNFDAVVVGRFDVLYGMRVIADQRNTERFRPAPAPPLIPLVGQRRAYFDE